MATNWKEAPDTPAWAGELLDAMGEAATTIEVAHYQAEVQLTARILTEQPVEVWQEWAQSNLSPDWMRSCIVEYSVCESRWQQVALISHLELMDEILGDMMSEEEGT